MEKPSAVCGNCGKPVAESDVTCPHCNVLLAAYVSPAGSTSPHVYESSAPIDDAVPEAEMYVPEPAAPVEIPDEVEVASTAPRPLFDTQLTIEDISKAAEGEHAESLVVVSEEKVVTKPTVFETPDWAKPPSDAKPVELVDGGDEELIARSAEEPAPSQPIPARSTAPATRPVSRTSLQARAEDRESAESEDDTESDRQSLTTATHPDARPTYAVPPARAEAASAPEVEPERRTESWLYDLSQSGPAASPAKTRRERTDRPKPVRTTTQAPGKRGTTEDYLKKLHAEAGYVSDKEQLSRPVGTRSARRSMASQGLSDARMGCAGLLFGVAALLWFITLIMVVSGGEGIGVFAFLAILATWAAKNRQKFTSFLE